MLKDSIDIEDEFVFVQLNYLNSANGIEYLCIFVDCIFQEM